jgi:hypothetical protein
MSLRVFQPDVFQHNVFQVGSIAEVGGGGGFLPFPIRRRRPFPVVGAGYGVLPALEGEAHGEVDDVLDPELLLLLMLAA